MHLNLIFINSSCDNLINIFCCYSTNRDCASVDNAWGAGVVEHLLFFYSVILCNKLSSLLFRSHCSYFSINKYGGGAGMARGWRFPIGS